ETVRNTGKAVLLFEPSGLAAFAALSAIIDRREGRWAEALMIFGDARDFADRHSAALGEKSGSWERKIKNAGKAAAKGSAGYGLEEHRLPTNLSPATPSKSSGRKAPGRCFFGAASQSANGGPIRTFVLGLPRFLSRSRRRIPLRRTGCYRSTRLKPYTRRCSLLLRDDDRGLEVLRPQERVSRDRASAGSRRSSSPAAAHARGDSI